MALVSVLDVIWTFDEFIKPPGPKMVACIEPELGMFFRINSRPKWQTPVFLPREPDNLFLEHDSYLECGEPLEIDDYIIEQSLDKDGVIGRVAARHAPEIYAAVAKATTYSEEDRERVRVALGC